MSKKTAKNIAASVRDRLFNRAKNDQRPYNELLQYYAMERFLYRFSKSKHNKDFILKGALMLRVWNSPEFRATKDIDMLGKIKNDEDSIVTIFKEIMSVEVEADGVVFHPDSIQSERITEGADYEGIRIRFPANLGSARQIIQVDIGFGDVIFPAPQQSILPTMLEFPAPVLLAYTRESSMSEKFEAMISLGAANSRMKDFYDIWLLSRQFDFEGKVLAEAIRLTFKKRETTLSRQIHAFSKEFISEKQSQWATFHRRLNQPHVPESFREVVEQSEKFLVPITTALLENKEIPKQWTAPGPWKTDLKSS